MTYKLVVERDKEGSPLNGVEYMVTNALAEAGLKVIPMNTPVEFKDFLVIDTWDNIG